jgi:hypothetical protein
MTSTLQDKILGLLENSKETKALNLTMSNYAIVVQTDTGIYVLPYLMKDSSKVNTQGYNFGEWQKLPSLPLVKEEVPEELIKIKLTELLGSV